MNVMLRTRARLLRDLALLANDPVNSTRWPKEVKAACLNQAIDDVADSVLLPYVYTITGGFTSTTFETALPHYVNRKYMQPQIKSDAVNPNLNTGDNTLETWLDLPGWTVESDGEAGAVLRLTSLPYQEEGRILYWSPPSSVPLEDGVVLDAVGLSDTSMTVTMGEADDAVPIVGFVSINNEWLQYNGTTRSGTTVTLQNLVRGIHGTSASTHSSQDTVLWGVGADRHMLWEMYTLGAMSRLARSLMFSNPNDMQQYQWAMRYYDQMVTEKMMSYRPSYVPSARLRVTHLLTELE